MGRKMKFRFDQLRAIAAITRGASKGINDRSKIATASGGRWAENPMATRPASQATVNSASIGPCTAWAPVQLGTAVRKNPAITAMVKPKSIS